MSDETIVTLVSKDGIKFYVTEQEARVSAMIAALLDSPFKEAETGYIILKEFESPVVDQVVKYMRYKVKYDGSTKKTPKLVLDPALLLETARAAGFLQC